MQRDAEVGVTQPQGKDCQQTLGAEKGKGGILPLEPLEGAQPCGHFDSSSDTDLGLDPHNGKE